MLMHMHTDTHTYMHVHMHMHVYVYICTHMYVLRKPCTNTYATVLQIHSQQTCTSDDLTLYPKVRHPQIPPPAGEGAWQAMG